MVVAETCGLRAGGKCGSSVTWVARIDPSFSSPSTPHSQTTGRRTFPGGSTTTTWVECLCDGTTLFTRLGQLWGWSYVASYATRARMPPDSPPFFTSRLLLFSPRLLVVLHICISRSAFMMLEFETPASAAEPLSFFISGTMPELRGANYSEGPPRSGLSGDCGLRHMALCPPASANH